VRCNTSNCAGCCDSNDVCQLGQSAMACGTGGNACLSCGTGLTCSNATCVASGAGGGSGGGGGSATGGGGGSTGPKRVFVTSTSYSGNLQSAGGGNSGTAGGDALCNLAAQAAGVSGQYTAWLSSDSMRAFDRITGSGPWILMGTTTVLFNNKASLATQPLAAINRNERGQIESGNVYWTGTSAGGGPSGSDCNDWTSGSVAFDGTIGIGDVPTYDWTNETTASCSSQRALLCFER